MKPLNEAKRLKDGMYKSVQELSYELVDNPRAVSRLMEAMRHDLESAIPEPCSSCSGKAIDAQRSPPDVSSFNVKIEARAFCVHGKNAHCPDELPTYEEVENNFKMFGQNLPPEPVEIKEELPTSYGDW